MATQPEPAEQVQIPDQAESMPVDQVPAVANVSIATPLPPQPTPPSSTHADTSIGDRIYKRLMSDSSEIEEEVISVPTDTGSEIVTLMDSVDQSKLMDTTGDQLKLIDMAGDQLKLMDTTGDQLKLMDTAGSQPKPMDSTGNQSKMMNMVGNQPRLMETAGDQLASFLGRPGNEARDQPKLMNVVGNQPSPGDQPRVPRRVSYAEYKQRRKSATERRDSGGNEPGVSETKGQTIIIPGLDVSPVKSQEVERSAARIVGLSASTVIPDSAVVKRVLKTGSPSPVEKESPEKEKEIKRETTTKEKEIKREMTTATTSVCTSLDTQKQLSVVSRTVAKQPTDNKARVSQDLPPSKAAPTSTSISAVKGSSSSPKLVISDHSKSPIALASSVSIKAEREKDKVPTPVVQRTTDTAASEKESAVKSGTSSKDVIGRVTPSQVSSVSPIQRFSIPVHQGGAQPIAPATHEPIASKHTHEPIVPPRQHEAPSHFLLPPPPPQPAPGPHGHPGSWFSPAWTRNVLPPHMPPPPQDPWRSISGFFHGGYYGQFPPGISPEDIPPPPPDESPSPSISSSRSSRSPSLSRSATPTGDDSSEAVGDEEGKTPTTSIDVGTQATWKMSSQHIQVGSGFKFRSMSTQTIKPFFTRSLAIQVNMDPKMYSKRVQTNPPHIVSSFSQTVSTKTRNRGIQTDPEPEPPKPLHPGLEALKVLVGNVEFSDGEEIVKKLRDYLAKRIGLDTESVSDYEPIDMSCDEEHRGEDNVFGGDEKPQSTGSPGIPSPVISGASNISEGDLSDLLSEGSPVEKVTPMPEPDSPLRPINPDAKDSHDQRHVVAENETAVLLEPEEKHQPADTETSCPSEMETTVDNKEKTTSQTKRDIPPPLPPLPPPSSSPPLPPAPPVSPPPPPSDPPHFPTVTESRAKPPCPPEQPQTQQQSDSTLVSDQELSPVDQQQTIELLPPSHKEPSLSTEAQEVHMQTSETTSVVDFQSEELDESSSVCYVRCMSLPPFKLSGASSRSTPSSSPSTPEFPDVAQIAPDHTGEANRRACSSSPPTARRFKKPAVTKEELLAKVRAKKSPFGTCLEAVAKEPPKKEMIPQTRMEEESGNEKKGSIDMHQLMVNFHNHMAQVASRKVQDVSWIKYHPPYSAHYPTMPCPFYSSPMVGLSPLTQFPPISLDHGGQQRAVPKETVPPSVGSPGSVEVRVPPEPHTPAPVEDSHTAPQSELCTPVLSAQVGEAWLKPEKEPEHYPSPLADDAEVSSMVKLPTPKCSPSLPLSEDQNTVVVQVSEEKGGGGEEDSSAEPSSKEPDEGRTLPTAIAKLLTEFSNTPVSDVPTPNLPPPTPDSTPLVNLSLSSLAETPTTMFYSASATPQSTPTEWFTPSQQINQPAGTRQARRSMLGLAAIESPYVPPIERAIPEEEEEPMDVSNKSPRCGEDPQQVFKTDAAVLEDSQDPSRSDQHDLKSDQPQSERTQPEGHAEQGQGMLGFSSGESKSQIDHSRCSPVTDRSPMEFVDRSPIGLADRSPIGLADRSPVGLAERSPMGLADRFPMGLVGYESGSPSKGQVSDQGQFHKEAKAEGGIEQGGEGKKVAGEAVGASDLGCPAQKPFHEVVSTEHSAEVAISPRADYAQGTERRTTAKDEECGKEETRFSTEEDFESSPEKLRGADVEEFNFSKVESPESHPLQSPPSPCSAPDHLGVPTSPLPVTTADYSDDVQRVTTADYSDDVQRRSVVSSSCITETETEEAASESSEMELVASLEAVKIDCPDSCGDVPENDMSQRELESCVDSTLLHVVTQELTERAAEISPKGGLIISIPTDRYAVQSGEVLTHNRLFSLDQLRPSDPSDIYLRVDKVPSPSSSHLPTVNESFTPFGETASQYECKSDKDHDAMQGDYSSEGLHFFTEVATPEVCGHLTPDSQNPSPSSQHDMSLRHSFPRPSFKPSSLAISTHPHTTLPSALSPTSNLGEFIPLSQREDEPSVVTSEPSSLHSCNATPVETTTTPAISSPPPCRSPPATSTPIEHSVYYTPSKELAPGSSFQRLDDTAKDKPLQTEDTVVDDEFVDKATAFNQSTSNNVNCSISIQLKSMQLKDAQSISVESTARQPETKSAGLPEAVCQVEPGSGAKGNLEQFDCSSRSETTSQQLLERCENLEHTRGEGIRGVKEVESEISSQVKMHKKVITVASSPVEHGNGSEETVPSEVDPNCGQFTCLQEEGTKLEVQGDSDNLEEGEIVESNLSQDDSELPQKKDPDIVVIDLTDSPSTSMIDLTKDSPVTLPSRGVHKATKKTKVRHTPTRPPLFESPPITQDTAGVRPEIAKLLVTLLQAEHAKQCSALNASVSPHFTSQPLLSSPPRPFGPNATFQPFGPSPVPHTCANEDIAHIQIQAVLPAGLIPPTPPCSTVESVHRLMSSSSSFRNQSPVFNVLTQTSPPREIGASQHLTQPSDLVLSKPTLLMQEQNNMTMNEGDPQLRQQPCVSENPVIASLARQSMSNSPPPHTSKSTHPSESSPVPLNQSSSGSKSTLRSSSSSRSSSCDSPTSNLDSISQKPSSWESRQETPRRRSPPSPPRSLFPPSLSHQSYRRNWDDDFPPHKSHWDLQRSPYTLPPLTLHRRFHRPIPPPPEWRYGPAPRHRRGAPYDLPPLELRHRWPEDDVYYTPNRYF